MHRRRAFLASFMYVRINKNCLTFFMKRSNETYLYIFVSYHAETCVYIFHSINKKNIDDVYFFIFLNYTSFFLEDVLSPRGTLYVNFKVICASVTLLYTEKECFSEN